MNIYQAKVLLDSRETSSGKATEYYLVEAFSLTDAEALLVKELTPRSSVGTKLVESADGAESRVENIPGRIEVTAISQKKVADFLHAPITPDTDVRYYSAVLGYEEEGKTKKETYLISASSFGEAYELLEDYTGAYRLLSIVETPVLDFLQHASPSQAEA